MNIFITSINVEYDAKPMIQVEVNPRPPIMIDYGPSHIDESVQIETIKATFLIRRLDKEWRYGFSEEVQEELKPILDLVKDQTADISRLHQDISTIRHLSEENIDAMRRTRDQYATTIDSLRTNRMKRLKFLFKRNMTLA